MFGMFRTANSFTAYRYANPLRLAKKKHTTWTKVKCNA